jgi:hypothetical protein
MIESFYWKEELHRIARSIQRVSKPPRWSERAHCIVERDLMIGFFMLRRLIELHKVSTVTRDQMLNVFSYLARGKNVTRFNGHDLWELYDLDREVPSTQKPGYIANQFIHAYTSFVARDESRNWSDVFVVSDYDRNDCIWRVPIPEIRRIFRTAAEDYPHSIRMVFNAKKGDYDVQTN